MIGNRQIVDGSVVDGSVAELCLVTDVDRTCYNTSKGAELLLGAAAQVLGADTSEVTSSINCRRKQGLTTQIHDWLKDSGASPRQIDDVYQWFVDTTDPDAVKYDDTDNYFRAIGESDVVTAVLLTMGPRDQQEAKICAMGLQGYVPYVITDPRETANAVQKDWQIRSWANERGLVVPIVAAASIGSMAARSAILIDDKYEAFGPMAKLPKRGDQPGIGGFWLNRPGSGSRASEGIIGLEPLPAAIEYASSLREIAALVRMRDVLPNLRMSTYRHEAPETLLKG